MLIDEDDYLAHYGTPRHSGRYPWGSTGNVPGSEPTTHHEDFVKELNKAGKKVSDVPSPQSVRNQDFLGFVGDLKRAGLSEATIAKGFGIPLTQLRARKAIVRNQRKQEEIDTAQKLHNKGMSMREISMQMFGTYSKDTTVRTLLEPGAKDKAKILDATADILKQEVADKTYVDIGSGSEHSFPMGISRTKMDNAVALLKEQGYEVHTVPVTQLTTGHETKTKVLAPPGTKWRDVAMNKLDIKPLGSWTNDGGRSYSKPVPPLPVSRDRVHIVTREEGGSQADGMIYVRPGVEDLSLGKGRYAQVRIQVGDNHFLKGMAMYKDDLPAGKDLVFNTAKSLSEKPHDKTEDDYLMKELVRDETTGKVVDDLPFGAIVRQIPKLDENGDEIPGTVASAMNIVGSGPNANEEGTWDRWSRNLSSQMLSKQRPSLVKSQLEMTYEGRVNRYEQIKQLTNPVVRKKMLEDFAEASDKAAVHLKAAKLPRQATKVILPLDKIKEDQIYAPSLNHGETVALIRHPHAGTFEIPILTVNNRNPQGKKVLGGDVLDAVGIHPEVAKRLSGADFDGDTVVVIPNNSGKVKSTPALEGLKDFDPRASYPEYPGMKPIGNMQAQMGEVSNLITDMTIKLAPPEDIVKAVRHSMVIIDSEKHNLNFRKSAIDNDIAGLKAKYQAGEDGRAGASTLISRAGSQYYVPHRRLRRQSEGPPGNRGPVDTKTGKLVYVYTDKRKPDGSVLEVESEKLKEYDNAHDLSSGTPIEGYYADYSNKVKALANQARLDALAIKPPPQSYSAKQTYAKEVASLNSKLHDVESNRPKEREAQRVGNATYRARVQSNPNMEPKEKKRVKNQAIQDARNRLGAHSGKVVITPSEWDAIQANAISASKLAQILRKADMDVVNDLATPKEPPKLSTAKINNARNMLEAGYSLGDIATHLGVSPSYLDEILKGK